MCLVGEGNRKIERVCAAVALRYDKEDANETRHRKGSASVVNPSNDADSSHGSKKEVFTV